ncbi:ispDF [Cladophialophora psammophila CBS 110553]|uniref:2-C-methyl-D-erythritol 4-phosphate cytidylyltransferase, chloroplastic n=1 Tax=Cladophialophora psammophila CBS 110553 TaxID=1182543 RepID=W9W496_9EURO|nr:ispDF [Cladophialophora psammophila CBS 110553]EXJ59336.1 ispDF [Cladophialophora psammophila CBS 110553]
MVLPKTEEKPHSGPELKFGVVILAAGRAIRAGDLCCPKPYRRIAGETVISRVVRTFRSWNSDCPIVIVRHADDAVLLEEAIRNRDQRIYDTIGGDTRQASALAGLRFIAGIGIPLSHVFIHDGARPLVSRSLLERLQAALVEEPQVGVIPAIPIMDTIKQAGPNNIITRTVPRDRLYRSQTPQGFALQVILDVHEQATRAAVTDFTDDASLFEWTGMAVRIVAGETRNLKITYHEDFEEAERILKAESTSTKPDVRVGHGYDTHKLVPGRRIVLCGVHIEHNSSLLGHSDADVGLHALTNALLATIGAGDIGSHFPPSDPRWKGVSSGRFLQHAARLVKGAGGTITHCDVTLVCETPKISPYRDAMKESVAAILCLSRSRVSIKAATNEQMGFVGHQEGIMGLSTATAVFSEESCSI